LSVKRSGFGSDKVTRQNKCFDRKSLTVIASEAKQSSLGGGNR
jgi:hypothetical protein